MARRSSNNSVKRNINAMRPAILRVRENGNRQPISKSLCAELGISEVYFKMYEDDMKKLFEAVTAYCRIKNSSGVDEKEVEKAYNTIFPLWKEMLATGEKDEFSNDLRANKHDVSNLVSFCQTFMNAENNSSFEENFVPTKAWATQTLRQFWKKVETDLGIRAAQVEVLSDEKRDFLRNESKILRKILKTERRIKDLTAHKDGLSVMAGKHDNPEVRAIFEEQIADYDAQIASLAAKIDDYKEQHRLLLNPPDDAIVEQVPIVADAEKPKARSRKKIVEDDTPAEKKAPAKRGRKAKTAEVSPRQDIVEVAPEPTETAPDEQLAAVAG